MRALGKTMLNGYYRIAFVRGYDTQGASLQQTSELHISFVDLRNLEKSTVEGPWPHGVFEISINCVDASCIRKPLSSVSCSSM
jgi:hypothetical protein